MLTCKQVTQLASESLDRKLSLGERIRLRLHLFTCKLCVRFDRQLKFIRQATRAVDEDKLTQASPRLSETARKRIQKKLNSET